MVFTRLFGKSDSSKNWIPDPALKLTIYVGFPLNRPKFWAQVTEYDAHSITLPAGMKVSPMEVPSYLLVYQNGDIMSGENLFWPLPEGTTFLEPKKDPGGPIELDAMLIKFGKIILSIHHGDYRKNAEGKRIYTTTLKNIYNEPIRITHFASYIRSWRKYRINTVTGDVYSADQFISWYGASVDGWIAPGEFVADTSNYGGGGMWTFFGETASGQKFIAMDTPS